MPNVPNIVRERLKAAALPIDHPDANVLTAFSERSLPAGERGVVLDHIARCGECREILALSLPQAEEVQLLATPSRSVGPRGWLTWPSLRWGFVAAGVLLIGSLGVVKYHRYQTLAPSTAATPSIHNEVAKNEALPSPPVPSASIPAEAPVEHRDKSQSNRRTALDSAGASSANSIAAESKDDLKTEPQRVAIMPLAKQRTAPTVPAPAPVPTSPEMVEVQSESAQVNADKTLDLPVQKGSVPDRASANYSESAVGKAKLPVAEQTASAAPAVNGLNPLPLQTQPSLLRSYTAPLPRWTISANGGLQRSYDSGKTWQNVDVNSSPTSSADSLALVAGNVSADSKSDKDSDVKSMKRMPANSVTPTIFRAVAANGADVWAGGSSGALYHSLDAGLHWTRVRPSSSSVALTGDIVALEFSGTQHGKIATSSGETWITPDDGQSWQKQ
jgi:Photosynthesis system II assembly factor YCF48